MKIYIGIDPGQTGAIAYIRGIPSIAEVFDFENSFECVTSLGLLSLEKEKKAMIEKAHAMPKQGVSSMFKFGTAYGRVIGWLEAQGIPFEFVTPAKWKKEIFDSMPKTDQKSMSLDLARRLFPALGEKLKRKGDHNRAEALLLAEYCRRIEI
jgi:hypothetical protein